MSQIVRDMLRKINDIFSVDSQNHIIDTRTMTDTGQILNASNYSEIMNGTFSPYPLTALGGQQAGVGAGTGRLAGMFAGLRGRFGADKALLGGTLDLSSLKNLGSDIRSTKLIQGGPSLGNMAAAGMGLYQGATALKGLYENMNSDRDLSSLKDDIRIAEASNPMHGMYLDPSDQKLLRQLNNGSLTNNWGSAASGAIQGIPQAALTALIGGMTGGAPGAILGGLGSLSNSAISGYGKGNSEAYAKLQGLYDKLNRAGEDYRSMRRPAGLRQAGLSTQYFNQLY